MSNLISLFAGIPEYLRVEIINEYKLISQNYFERRWLASELHGGRFCEILYCLLEGMGTGKFSGVISKPKNFVEACKKLENNSNLPRSFQILIPRILPALYEIRNNRNVGHAGGDVDSNSMDSHFVFSTVSWIIGELVRYFHQVTTVDAQYLVDSITERKFELVWEQDGVKRLLNPKIPKKHQALILLCSTLDMVVEINTLQSWIEYKNRSNFLKMLRGLHKERLIELKNDKAVLLPTGSKFASELIAKYK